MFVVDEVDVWVPAVVTAVKHDGISVIIEPTNQVSELFIGMFTTTGNTMCGVL